MILILVLLSGAFSCGVSVHQSILARITPQLPQNVTDRLQFARAGAFFPDAFYGCMDQSDAAEAAHWPPFLARGAQMVRDKMSGGDNEGALNLYSFLLGVLSHQVADVTWHSLGVQQGLLEAMSQIEFDGDIDDAHSTLDVGGDFIYLHRLFASGSQYEWIQQSWDYNSDDIVTLLSSLGYDVSKFQLSYCMSRGRAALGAEIRVADPAYLHYAQKSPLLFGNLEEYFNGGIADMHAQTLECLHTFETWMYDSPEDSWDLCQVFDGKRPRLSKRRSIASRIRRGMHSAHSYFQIKKAAEPIYDANSQILSGIEPWSHFGKAVAWWPEPRIWVVSSPQDGKIHYYDDNVNHITSIQGPKKLPGLYHARFGASLVPIRVDNRDYLVASSPGLSRLDIFTPIGEHAGGLMWEDAQVHFGQAGCKLVGESLLYDENMLYVGAPFSDDDGQPQSGAVYIVNQDTLKKATAGKILQISPSKLKHEPSKYGRFGAKLARSNLFLLAGCPGEDAVYGFDRLTHGRLLALTGDTHSGFGGHLLAASENQMVIGAPLGDYNGEQSGAVYFYEFTRRTTLKGQSAYERFGHSGTFQGSTVYIGSPFADGEHGALWNHTVYHQDYTKMSNGPSPFSGAFCDSVVSNGTVIACGSPFQNSTGAVVFAYV